MSYEYYEDSGSCDDQPVDPVYCELRGGAHDGFLFLSSRRFERLNCEMKVVALSKGQELLASECTYDSFYEYSNLYRVCRLRGIVFLFVHVGVEVYDQGQLLHRIGNTERKDGACEWEDVFPEDLLGLYGKDEWQDE